MRSCTVAYLTGEIFFDVKIDKIEITQLKV